MKSTLSFGKYMVSLRSRVRERALVTSEILCRVPDPFCAGTGSTSNNLIWMVDDHETISGQVPSKRETKNVFGICKEKLGSRGRRILFFG